VTDQARPLKALSLLGYLGMMSGLLALVWLHSLFSISPIVIALQVSALVLFFWARITFGRRSFHVAANPTEGGLVDTGPYRYIRHPIYTALCLFTGAGAVAHLSWKTELAFGLILGFALLRIFCEESLVAKQYPEYREYAGRTWRMVPGIF
jgi:protein-S-isoprenylcysteine O-methyltransferase Ste14